MSSAIILNLVVISVVVAGWTAAVWAFYIRLDEGRATARTARVREVTAAATRRDVRRAA